MKVTVLVRFLSCQDNIPMLANTGRTYNEEFTVARNSPILRNIECSLLLMAETLVPKWLSHAYSLTALMELMTSPKRRILSSTALVCFLLNCIILPKIHAKHQCV